METEIKQIQLKIKSLLNTSYNDWYQYMALTCKDKTLDEILLIVLRQYNTLQYDISDMIGDDFEVVEKSYKNIDRNNPCYERLQKLNSTYDPVSNSKG